MGRYFNPVDELPRVGRQLLALGGYQSVVRQLQHGEVLVGLYGNGLWKSAPFLMTEQNYQHFDQAYSEGRWISYQLYAVPEHKVRTMLQGQPVGKDL